MIEARIIADSLAPCGSRLTTFVCAYPRFIHAEVMTHRAFSRNAASSRAIPVQTMIDKIQKQTASPISWGKNQKGMQANEELSPDIAEKAMQVWKQSMEVAVGHAKALLELGVHKQIANRILEPYAHMVTIITATEFENFFSLRADPDAQPEFQQLAYLMMEAYILDKPNELKCGEWHLPFADKYIKDGLTTEQLLKITTARCARVSYMNFEGDFDYNKDYNLHDDLLVSGHVSPFEHAARAEATRIRSGNFVGFTQYRKLLHNECRSLSRDEMIERVIKRKK